MCSIALRRATPARRKTQGQDAPLTTCSLQTRERQPAVRFATALEPRHASPTTHSPEDAPRFGASRPRVGSAGFAARVHQRTLLFSAHRCRQLKCNPHGPPDLLARNPGGQGLVHGAALEFLQDNRRCPAPGILSTKRGSEPRPQFHFAHVGNPTQPATSGPRTPPHLQPSFQGVVKLPHREPLRILTSRTAASCSRNTSTGYEIRPPTNRETSYPKWPTANRGTFSLH